MSKTPSFTNLFSRPSPRVSFEFFPPKSAEMETRLWETIQILAPLAPDFVSVTYGAGGSTRERTHHTVTRIVKETALTPAAHLTLIGAGRDEILAIAEEYWESGVKHIVALRGDPQDPALPFIPHPHGYRYASELVADLKTIAPFEISVAAFPEGHPENGSVEQDIENLARKVEAGATRAITQFFFDVDVYLDYVEKAKRAGITIPIIPGILPVTNFQQLKKFAGLCGASLPQWLAHLFEGLDDSPQHRSHVAVIVAAEQCRILREAGVDTFHFYTLNRAELTLALCHILNVRARVPA